MSDIFFSAGYFFPRNLFACFFFPHEISVQDIFFPKSLITPSKVKWSALKINQKFGQLTGSDLSIISKGFWNNREQNSLGERAGIRFYLPLPGKSVRTIFSRIDCLPNFITLFQEAPLIWPNGRCWVFLSCFVFPLGILYFAAFFFVCLFVCCCCFFGFLKHSLHSDQVLY